MGRNGLGTSLNTWKNLLKSNPCFIPTIKRVGFPIHITLEIFGKSKYFRFTHFSICVNRKREITSLVVIGIGYVRNLHKIGQSKNLLSYGLGTAIPKAIIRQKRTKRQEFKS